MAEPTIIPQTIDEQLQAAFDNAQSDGYVHARELDGDGEVRFRSDRVNHLASTGKVPILVALMRSIAAGEHALDERVRIPAPGGGAQQLLGAMSRTDSGEIPDLDMTRTPGPTGLSVMKHEAELSIRDIAQLMIAISDNAATDIILGFVPPERVTAAMRDLGLRQITIDETIADMYRRAIERARSAKSPEEAEAGARAETQPENAGWRGTAEEMTALLAMIWQDEAAPAGLCAEMRELLYSQHAPHRFSAAFPDGIAIGAKTGTTQHVRNEVGVIEYPDGKRYAVAVFTRPQSPALRNPTADRVVGTAARLAIEHIRGV